MESTAEKRKSFKVPHTYAIIFIFMIIMSVLTWVIPSGAYETT